MNDQNSLSEANAPNHRMFRARDTIAAVSTAPGRAAIAVIRLSGPEAGPSLDAIAGARPRARRAALKTFRDPRTDEPIDSGLALWFPGPASVTGEDIAEFHIHGGRAVAAAMLDALLAQEGVRAAEPGEFTRRAFVNERIDLAEAEGLADLLEAETEAQRRQALRQSGGALSRTVEGWRAGITAALALVEAGIDFADEDGVPEEVRLQAHEDVLTLAGALRAAVDDRRAERLRDGFHVAILGRPNAGKSSLLNALARREVAIVTETPGATRDIIEVHLDLDGLPVTIADTAGIREAADAVEQEGVRRARTRAGTADLVIWLHEEPDAAPPELPGATRILEVRSKIDLTSGAAGGGLRISTTTGDGVDALVGVIAQAGRDAVDGDAGAGLSRARHRDAAAAAASLLEDALRDWNDLPDELLADLLRRAADELGRVTGRIGVEDVLGEIFSSFCIGK